MRTSHRFNVQSLSMCLLYGHVIRGNVEPADQLCVCVACHVDFGVILCECVHEQRRVPGLFSLVSLGLIYTLLRPCKSKIQALL